MVAPEFNHKVDHGVKILNRSKTHRSLLKHPRLSKQVGLL